VKQKQKFAFSTCQKIKIFLIKTFLSLLKPSRAKTPPNL